MAFSAQTRGRAWVGTIHINNMVKAEMTKEQYENPECLADFFISKWENSGKGRQAGITVCLSKEGRYHAHIACYGNTTTLRKVADVLCDAHIEPQLGGKEQLKAYLMKEGKYEEKGEQILFAKGLDCIQDNQGKRTDIEEIEALLEDGLTPDEIFAESFRFRKYERMVKADYLARRIRETPLIKTMHNEYHWGSSGSGKTYTYYKLCEEYSPADVYLCSDYANSNGSGGGFDFYANNPAKIIVLDEFRGNISYNQLLSMMDVYSRNQQHCRFQNTYALWTSVVICSVYPLEEVYRLMVSENHRSIDSFTQFLRRINVVVYHYVNNDGEYKTIELPASEYKSANQMKCMAMQKEQKESINAALKCFGVADK